MREIYFRGKDLNGNWREGDLIWATLGQGQKPMILDAFDEIDIGNNLYEVAPETVGQFTGMYDAEGREIYEGDIVKATLKEPSFVKRFKLQNEIVGEMFFDNAWWMKERETVNLIPPWRFRYYDLTVIGNVHDSPELLEADDA